MSLICSYRDDAEKEETTVPTSTTHSAPTIPYPKVLAEGTSDASVKEDEFLFFFRRFADVVGRGVLYVREEDETTNPICLSLDTDISANFTACSESSKCQC